MNIEDLIVSLTLSNVRLNPWDEKLVYSFYDQITKGLGFTEKQSLLAVKTLNRHYVSLSAFLQKDVSPFLTTPSYRLPIRQINNTKKINVVPSAVFGKEIKAFFPYNEKIVESIRKNKEDIGHAVWSKEEKCWIFALTENSIQFLSDLSSREHFEVDEEFENLQDQVNLIINNMENYIPMLVVDEKIPKIANFSKNTPLIESQDLMGAVFEARKMGIFTWDETISNFIDSDEVDPTTRLFLKTEPQENFHVDSDFHDISALGKIVTNLSPCLVVIPGGSEYETLVMAHTFMKELGIEDQEMSVMFRLPSTSHEIFNNFVKTNNLNNPITENTKVVFVSSKLPKPVLKSKLKFHCVLNMGFSSVHYTMKDFVGKHENLVFYSRKKEQRELKFAFL
jgi:hypothetical protein